MKSRVLSVFMAVIMVVSVMPVFMGSAGALLVSGDWEYSFYGNDVTINKYNGTGGDVTIPYIIDGKSVTKIAGYAFLNSTSPTSITIPDSVTSIGQAAFQYCRSLTSIIIPNSVTSIGYELFSGCSSLTSITIPNSVTSIDSSMFEGCSSLTSITIPDGVTSIGGRAFHNCTSLTSITIPKNVTSIGQDAFYNCTNLTSITIPNSVTSIGQWAFRNCTNLTSITIPDSVTSIENSTFEDCTSLTSITIPGSVTNIGTGAYNRCTSLASITIGNGVRNIGASAFRETAISSITIPDSVISIGSRAFWNCKSLTTLTIPDSVISIDDYAFSACSGLTTITISNSVTSIGGSVFRNCTSLTSITIPDSVTSIENSTFEDCTSLTSITIPDSVTNIGSSAFFRCTGLTSITIPNSVTSIESGAFQNCKSLTAITIPDSVTSIGSSAFLDCKSLTAITIPDSVTSIGKGAFNFCGKNEDGKFWIYGVPGSYAETYADSNGHRFIDINNKPIDPSLKKEITIKVTDGLDNPISGALIKIFPKMIFTFDTQKDRDFYNSIQKEYTTDENGEATVYGNLDSFDVTKDGFFEYSYIFERGEIIPETVTAVLPSHKIVIAKVDGSTDFTSSNGANTVKVGEALELIAYVEFADGRKDYSFDKFEWCPSESTYLPSNVDSIEMESKGTNHYSLKNKTDIDQNIIINVSPYITDPLRKTFIPDSVYIKFDGEPTTRILDYHDDFIHENRDMYVSWNLQMFEYDSRTIESNSPYYHANFAKISAVLSKNAYAGEGDDRMLDTFKKLGVKYDEDDEDKDKHFEPHFGSTYTNPQHFIAHTEIKIDDRTTQNIVFVVIRGTQNSADWTTNLDTMTNDSKEHTGFAYARDTVRDNLNAYLRAKGISANNSKILITGHSYGAAVANLLAKSIETSFDKGNIYCYTFAPPNNIVADSFNLDSISQDNSNIHNYRNTRDFAMYIPAAPFPIEVYTVYGKQHFFDLGDTNPWDFTFGSNHNMTNYIDYIREMSESVPLKSLPTRRVSIRCPVDVIAYDKDGNIVGKIINNTVDEETSIAMFVFGDEKLIILPTDESVSLSIIATDSGKMDITIYDSDLVSYDVISAKEYENIVLEEGKLFSTDINGEVIAEDVVLHVVDENGKPLAEVAVDGTERSTVVYKKGHILSNEDVTIFDALEILKYLVGMDGAIKDGNDAFYAALITGNSDKPTIFDALEILKYLVGMDNLI